MGGGGIENKENINNVIESPEKYGIIDYNQNWVDEQFSRWKSGEDYEAFLTNSVTSLNSKKMIQYDLVKSGYSISYKGMKPNMLGIDGDPGKITFGAIQKKLETLNVSTFAKKNIQSIDSTIGSIRADALSLRKSIQVETKSETGNILGNIDNKVIKQKLSDPKVKDNYDYSETAYNLAPKFDYISLADVRGLMRYESYFKHESKSNTGSTGIMQLTSVAFGDIKENQKLYDKEYLQKVFEAEGLDYQKIINGLTSKTKKNSAGVGYKYFTFAGGDEGRKAVFNNRNINVALGLSCLMGCEKRGIFSAANEAIKNDLVQIASRAKVKLKARGIVVDDNKMKQLSEDLKQNKKLKNKFAVFARYNGERDKGDGITVEDRFVYAMSVLYLGQETFA